MVWQKTQHKTVHVIQVHTISKKKIMNAFHLSRQSPAVCYVGFLTSSCNQTSTAPWVLILVFMLSAKSYFISKMHLFHPVLEKSETTFIISSSRQSSVSCSFMAKRNKINNYYTKKKKLFKAASASYFKLQYICKGNLTFLFHYNCFGQVHSSYLLQEEMW